MDESYDIVVVGGGLAGLTAAATAASGSGSVLVLDARAEPGGRAVTDEVGRFRFNRGAHALYRTTPGRDVLNRLGVRVRGVPPPLRGGQGRLGDDVGLLPQDVGSLLRTRLVGVRDKATLARLLGGVRRWEPETLADKSISQWLDDHDLDGVPRQLAEMLVRLTSFVVDTPWVSADLAATQIKAGLTGGVEYLDGGWATLVDGLAAATTRAGAEFRPGQSVQAVLPDGGHVVVQTIQGRIVARQVVLAVGGPAACAALLPEIPAAWSRQGSALRAACLDVGLAAMPPTSVLLGVDRPLYLVRHGPPAAGLAPAGGAAVHTVRYLGSDEDPSPDATRAELAEHCAVAGIDVEAAEEVRYLHRMVVCGATPTPAEGGLAGRPGVDTGFPGVRVAGDWVGPVGHLADAALVSGEQAGRAAVDGLARGRTVPLAS